MTGVQTCALPICVVVCLGCGSSAAADSQDSAWRKVRHEGHAHTQRFYQLTLLVLTEEPPEALKPLAEEAAEALGEVLEGLPPEVGWLLLEDLRPL